MMQPRPAPYEIERMPDPRPAPYELRPLPRGWTKLYDMDTGRSFFIE